LADDLTVKTRLALPKGRMLKDTAEFLASAGVPFDGYNSSTRIYRLQSTSMPLLTAKMLNERDIPVQVAIGNYDFGICTSDWLQELQVRYPASRVFKLADLGYDSSGIFLACSSRSSISTSSLASGNRTWRIVSEYPALAEATAIKMRLKRFRVFPVWGSSEAYPSENADFAVLRARDESALRILGLKALKKICDSDACFIANTDGYQAGEFSGLLARINRGRKRNRAIAIPASSTVKETEMPRPLKSGKEGVWLALADGHQQVFTAAFLEKAGLKFKGYSGSSLTRRPESGLDWLNLKVIRPQDMPQQVANGNFDLAITGRDWMLDHLYQFPSSPVVELVNLGFGWVRVVAVVSQDLPADSMEEVQAIIRGGKLTPLRVATEYVNIADKYMRDKHIARYRVIPTWGATEVYLPEDADMLIENTETGKTLARHNLKIVDTLFESTACLIGNCRSLETPGKGSYIRKLARIFREAAEGKCN